MLSAPQSTRTQLKPAGVAHDPSAPHVNVVDPLLFCSYPAAHTPVHVAWYPVPVHPVATAFELLSDSVPHDTGVHTIAPSHDPSSPHVNVELEGDAW